MYESIYIIHTLYLLYVSVTHVAVFSEAQYKGQLYRMRRYKALSFKSSAWFKIHIID